MKKYYPWVVVALLSVVALLNYLDRQMLSTMQQYMAEDFAELKNAEMFGVLMSAFMWVYAFVSPFGGIVADKVSRKWLVVCSLAVWSAVTCLMGYAESFDQLWWLRAMMGISEALYIPSALSLIADWHKGGSRSLAVGLHMTGLYLGQALGGFGAMVSDQLSWQATFQILGYFGVAYAVVLIFFLKENRTEKPRAATTETVQGNKVALLFASVGTVLCIGAFWALLAAFALSSLPGWATKNWLPTLLHQNLSLDMVVAGPWATISLAAASFIGAFLGGSISDRWVKTNIRGRVFTSAIGISLMVPSLACLGIGNSMAMVVGGVLLFGIGYGIFDTNNMPILCQFVPTNSRATAYGLMNMTGVLFGALITEVMPRLGSDMGVIFASMAVVAAFTVTIQLTFLRPKVDNME
ncbi:MAG: MFS transporter [Bacteroidaceae bacterium]|nr:MFS transporter [Bacteroidaceae bacterium]